MAAPGRGSPYQWEGLERTGSPSALVPTFWVGRVRLLKERLQKKVGTLIPTFLLEDLENRSLVRRPFEKWLGLACPFFGLCWPKAAGARGWSAPRGKQSSQRRGKERNQG